MALSDILKKLAAAANGAKDKANSYGAWLNGAVNDAKDAVGGAVSNIKNNISGAVSEIGSTAARAGDAAGQAVSAAQNAVSGAVSNVGQAVDYAKEQIPAVKEQAEGAVTEAVDQAKTQAGEFASGMKEQVGNAVNGAVDTAKAKAEGAVGQAVDYVKGAVSEGAQNITDGVVGANEKIQQAVGENSELGIRNEEITSDGTSRRRPLQTEGTPHPSAVPTPSPEGKVLEAGASGNSGTSSTASAVPLPQGGKVLEEAETGGAAASAPKVDSYAEWLQKKNEGLGYIKDETINHYDKQNAETLAAIEEAKNAANTEAGKQHSMTHTAIGAERDAAIAQAGAERDLLVGTSEMERAAVYAFAESQGIADKNLAADMYNQLVDSINAAKNSGAALAEEQRDLLINMSSEERDAVYRAADERLAESLGFNKESYDTLVGAIEAAKNSGTSLAESQKKMLLDMSEEQRQAVYAAAERARGEAEIEADVARQRAIVDANSAYAQNKAGYGANAEALGNMGIAGGGYSDWLNASSYATQRAETQAARAQSDAAKRQARYTEDQAKLQADSDYNNKKYTAEREYSDRMYDIDTTYRTNMLSAGQEKARADREARDAAAQSKSSADSAHRQNEYSAKSGYADKMYDIDTSYRTNMLSANQEKARADYEAESVERDTKRQADSAHNQNLYNAESAHSKAVYGAESDARKAKLENDLSYSTNLFNNDAKAKEQELQANREAAEGKLGANLSYAENMLNNGDAIAVYKRLLETDGKESEALKKDIYTELLSGANSGAYTAEQARDLAARFGLDEAAQDLLGKAAEEYAGKVSGAESDAQTTETRNNYTNLLIGAANGEYDEATVKALASEYGLNETQTEALVKAAQGYAGKVSDAEGKADAEVASQRYTSLLAQVGNGAYTKDVALAMAKEWGLSEDQISEITKAADAYATETGSAAALDEATQDGKTFVGLLDSIASGAFDGYSADQIAQIAGELGLTLSDTQKGLVTQAMNNYSGNAGEADTNYKNGVYMELLSGAKNGAYTEAEISDFVTRYGLDENMSKNLTQAVTDYNAKMSTAEGESAAREKTANFVDLLARAKSGELTKEELLQVAKELGFDETADKTQLDLLSAAADKFATGTAKDEAAAKNMSFISLLDGANTGAYTADQISEMAEMFGFDPKNEDDAQLIGMLTQAATNYANGVTASEAKEDTQYMNGVFAELLESASSGDMSADSIKYFAEKFGFEGEDLTALENAANDAVSKKQANNSANIAANMGDTIGAIDALEEAGEISPKDAAARREKIQGENYESYVDAITYGTANTVEIDNAAKNEEISKEQYEELKKRWNDTVDYSEDAFKLDGQWLSQADALKVLQGKIVTGWTDDIKYQELVAIYNRHYINNEGIVDTIYNGHYLNNKYTLGVYN